MAGALRFLCSDIDIRCAPTQCSQRQEKRERCDVPKLILRCPTVVRSSTAPPARFGSDFDLPSLSRQFQAVHPSRFECGQCEFSFSRADETYGEDRDFFSTFARRRGRYEGGGGGNSYFVILVIDAPGAVLSNSQTIEANRVRRAVAVSWSHRRSTWETARRASGSRC